MRDHLPFESPDHELSPQELEKIAMTVGQNPSLWEDGLRRTTAERTYTDVFTSEHLGVWAISWMADGHDTGYHDHTTSNGGVYVARGAIRHEHLRLGNRPVGKAVREGETFGFDSTFIHRMRREPGAGPTITVHAYSPPLTDTGQYAEFEDGLLHRHPSPAEEQLKAHGYQGSPTTGTAP
jgi:hypothetical protein